MHSKTLIWAKPKLMESHNNKGKLWLISVVELYNVEQKTTYINRHAHQWVLGANFVKFSTKSWEIFWKNVVFSSVKLTNFAAFFFFLRKLVQNFQYQKIEKTNPWWPYTKKNKNLSWVFWPQILTGRWQKMSGFFVLQLSFAVFFFVGGGVFFSPFVWSFCSSW